MAYLPDLRLLIAASMAVLLSTPAAPGFAEEFSRIPGTRIESLELPGLTAGCHVCEWRPKLNEMPSLEQCGADDSGSPRIGLFECGFSQDCERKCNFLRCASP